MPKTDELNQTVNQICQQYLNDENKVVLSSIWEFNEIVDDIFDPYTADYEEGYNNRNLTLNERSQILDAICSVYSVKNMDHQELTDNLFSEYID